MLEMCVDFTGSEQAGFSTGVLMLLGNAGGVVVSVVIALTVKETYGRLIRRMLSTNAS